MGLATLDVPIVSFRILYLLVQRLLQILNLKIIRESRTLTRLHQSSLQIFYFFLLLELLDLLREIDWRWLSWLGPLKNFHFSDTITIRNRHMIAMNGKLPRKVPIFLTSQLRCLVSLLLVPQQHMFLHFRYILRGLVLRVCKLHQRLSVANRRVLNITPVGLLLQQQLLVLLAHLLLDHI